MTYRMHLNNSMNSKYLTDCELFFIPIFVYSVLTFSYIVYSWTIDNSTVECACGVCIVLHWIFIFYHP